MVSIYWEIVTNYLNLCKNKWIFKDLSKKCSNVVYSHNNNKVGKEKQVNVGLLFKLFFNMKERSMKSLNGAVVTDRNDTNKEKQAKQIQKYVCHPVVVTSRSSHEEMTNICISIF